MNIFQNMKSVILTLIAYTIYFLLYWKMPFYFELTERQIDLFRNLWMVGFIIVVMIVSLVARDRLATSSLLLFAPAILLLLLGSSRMWGCFIPNLLLSSGGFAIVYRLIHTKVEGQSANLVSMLLMGGTLVLIQIFNPVAVVLYSGPR